MASANSRATAFREYVGRPEFVCTIGAGMARNDRLPVAELPDDPKDQIRVIRDAVQGLLASGKGAATALVYPREPQSYEDLELLHRGVHASVFTVCAAEDIAGAARRGSMRLPKADMGVPRPMLPFVAAEIVRQTNGAFFALPGQALVAKMGLPVAADPYDSLADIREGSEAMLGVSPNAMPAVDGHAIQTIVMSPVYTGDSSEKVNAALSALGLKETAHGRYAPATAMVLNFARDVLDARITAAGIDIRARMQAATVGRYKAMHVLAEKPDAEARFHKLLTALRERAAKDPSH